MNIFVTIWKNRNFDPIQNVVVHILDTNCVKNICYDLDKTLAPKYRSSFTGYQMLQEFFFFKKSICF